MSFFFFPNHREIREKGWKDMSLNLYRYRRTTTYIDGIYVRIRIHLDL
jgi:hypothetical protein